MAIATTLEVHAHSSHPINIEHLAPEELREMLWEHAREMIELLASVLGDGMRAGTVRSDMDPDELAHIVVQILSATHIHPVRETDLNPSISRYTDIVSRVIAP